MLKTILVPVDGSAASYKALNYAFNLGEAFKSRLIVLTVSDAFDLSPPGLKDLKVPAGELSPEEMILAGGAALAIAQKLAEKRGYDAIAFEKALSADPAARILQQAQIVNADTIVMGSRGLGTTKAFLLGSVSSRIASAAICPVVIVN